MPKDNARMNLSHPVPGSKSTRDGDNDELLNHLIYWALPWCRAGAVKIVHLPEGGVLDKTCSGELDQTWNIPSLDQGLLLVLISWIFEGQTQPGKWKKKLLPRLVLMIWCCNFNHLWPGACIWSYRVGEVAAKVFHCSCNQQIMLSCNEIVVSLLLSYYRIPNKDSGRLWLKGSAVAFWTVKSCFWLAGGLRWSPMIEPKYPVYLKSIGW